MRPLMAVLILALAACYSPRTVPADSYGLYGATMYDEPLQASLWIDPHTGSASFDLNKPAHVALFTWQPGGFFSMVYPRIGYGTRQAFYEGRNHLWTSTGMSFARSRRAGGTGYGVWPASTRPGGPMAGPTYYVLVASEEPLEVAPFYNAGASFAHRAYWSSNLYTATELLASQIVPRAGSSDWTVAYQVVWPEVRDEQRYRWISCPDGTVLAVPFDLLYLGAVVCPDGTRAVPAPSDTIEADVEGLSQRIAQRRAEAAQALSEDRADEAEVRELIRRLQAERRAPAEEVELPVPAWQRGERREAARRAAAAAASDTRPAIRPLPSPRPEDVRARPGAARAEAWPRPGADRTRPGADRTRPSAEPRSTGARTRPQPATRPTETRARPQTETRAPETRRPPPQTERTRSTETQRPPPDDAA
jgi:hypothetical protein